MCFTAPKEDTFVLEYMFFKPKKIQLSCTGNICFADGVMKTLWMATSLRLVWFLKQGHDLRFKSMNYRHNDSTICKLSMLIKIKSVAYSSQGSHTGQLDFCN